NLRPVLPILLLFQRNLCVIVSDLTFAFPPHLNYTHLSTIKKLSSLNQGTRVASRVATQVEDFKNESSSLTCDNEQYRIYVSQICSRSGFVTFFLTVRTNHRLSWGKNAITGSSHHIFYYDVPL